MEQTDANGNCDLAGERNECGAFESAATVAAKTGGSGFWRMIGKSRGAAGMRIAAAFCASASFVSAVPAAAQWTGFTNHGTARIAYDPQRIRWVGPVARIWIRVEGAILIDGMSFSISLRDIDCANQASRTEHTTGYRDDGSVIGRDDNPTPYSPIVAETMDEDLFRLVCTRQ
jgi:hypothetical protein